LSDRIGKGHRHGRHQVLLAGAGVGGFTRRPANMETGETGLSSPGN
jgi:hypothetical protein